MKHLFLIFIELKRRDWLQFVLFGLPPYLALQLMRSPYNHKNNYACAGDLTICLASLTGKAKSFMKYPG